jgi:putative membrane protein
MMMWWGYNYGWSMMLWMVLWNMFWLLLLGLLIWSLVRKFSPSTTTTRSRSIPDEPSALEILRRRYARGELDTATFEQMRTHLVERNEKQPVESMG